MRFDRVMGERAAGEVSSLVSQVIGSGRLACAANDAGHQSDNAVGRTDPLRPRLPSRVIGAITADDALWQSKKPAGNGF